MTDKAEQSPAADSVLDRRYVRVRDRRASGIVEFDFAIGAPEIFVELVLPADAFDRFCRDNAAIELTGGEPAADAFDVRLSRVQSGLPERGA